MCECGCNHPPDDPRDEIGVAAKALSGLSILLGSANDADHIPATKLHALVGVIEERLRPAADAVQNWTPPGWHPPAH